MEGPAVADLESLFVSDWAFATREDLASSSQSAHPAADQRPQDEASRRDAGTSLAQVVASGPDVADDPLYEALSR